MNDMSGTGEMLTVPGGGAKIWRMGRSFIAALALVPIGGCVTVKAPEKPIEINLNINIKQEVVYRLDEQAKDLIKSEASIF